MKWFKHTPDAILTSVGILTTGFDEPTVETIIINRATKSLTLYFQMIGRGSRLLPNKKEFTIIDLGNNAARFGLWDAPVDWQHIFKSPEYYLENLREDAEIEMHFKYEMPSEIRQLFKNSLEVDFDIDEAFKLALKKNLRPKTVIDESIDQHALMCVDNSDDLNEAKRLAKHLEESAAYRVKIFCRCLSNSTKNYRDWLLEEYKKNLQVAIGKKFRERLFSMAD